jgi:hypothetical protein
MKIGASLCLFYTIAANPNILERNKAAVDPHSKDR